MGTIALIYFPWCSTYTNLEELESSGIQLTLTALEFDPHLILLGHIVISSIIWLYLAVKTLMIWPIYVPICTGVASVTGFCETSSL